MSEELIKETTKRMEKLFKGASVESIKYMSEEDMLKFGWDKRGIIIDFDTNLQILVSADPECNGPGALITSSKGMPIIGPL